MSSGDGRDYSSECSPSATSDRPRRPGIRTLEGIKDRLQLLSERSGTGVHAENEGDVTIVCDLADDLRDAIVEYQVWGDIDKRMWDGSLTMRFIVRAAEGNLRTELWIDCERRIRVSRKHRILIVLCRMPVRRSFAFNWHRLTSRALNS